jgi:AraC family transcriptional activator of pobA
LVGTLSQLMPASVFGPWQGGHPRDERAVTEFEPVLYEEDHAHEHAELCLLIEGECRFSLARRSAVLRAGDLVICPAGVMHAESYVTEDSSYRLAWWSLNPTDASLHVTRYTPATGFELDHRMSLSELPGDAQRRLDRLRQSAEAGGAPEIDRLREALLTLALALYRRSLNRGAEKMDTKDFLVQRTIAFVRSNSDRALGLAEVAREVHVSPNYLTSLVRTVTGKSLGRFIAEERMLRAERLLENGDGAIKEVAALLGFSDTFSFSRAFKSFSGLSPSEWRNSRRA